MTCCQPPQTGEPEGCSCDDSPPQMPQDDCSGAGCGCPGGEEGSGSGLSQTAGAVSGLNLASPTPPSPAAPFTAVGPGGRVNPATGGLVTQLASQKGGSFDPIPSFAHNSTSQSASSVGKGWTGGLEKSLSASGGTVTLKSGSGTQRTYTSKDANGVFQPPPGAANSLKQDIDGTFVETQPNGFQSRYDSSGRLTSMQSVAGSIWTIGYDVAGRVESVVDPVAGRTSYVYDAGGLIQRTVDAYGRVTTFQHDIDGNLTKRICSELCVIEYRYDANSRIQATIDAEGLRTSF
ncbi:MAG: hypothetical protein DWH91_10850, partial [Planctomycetota bacterium]